MNTRTYELSTIPGAASAAVQTIVPLAGVLVTAFRILDGDVQWWTPLIFLIASILLLAVVLPAWANTVWRMLNERRAEEAEIAATTPQVVATRVAIQHEQERRLTITELSRLDQDQISYARQAGLSSSIDIYTATRVLWKPAGETGIPVYFAIEWWRKAQADDHNLPAQRDWSAEVDATTREQYRLYIQAINHALLRLGAVRDSGGPFPVRWIHTSQQARSQALGQIGFWTALAVAEWLSSEEQERTREPAPTATSPENYPRSYHPHIER